MALVKVEESPFVRDTNNRALINQNYGERDEYYSKVRILNNQRSEINKLNNEIGQLKDDLTVIKELLTQLISK